MPIVSPAEVAKASSLTLGDFVVRAPHTDHPVRWRALSDPITCRRGHMSIVLAGDGVYGKAFTLLAFVTDELVVERAGTEFAR